MNKDLQSELHLVQKECRNITKKPLKEVLKAYKSALEDVQKEIALITQKYEVDGVLNISSKQRYSTLKSLEDKLIQQAKALGETNVKYTTDTLTDVYNECYYRTAYTIDKGVDTILDFSILKPEFVEATINTPIDKQTFSKRIWKNQQKLTDRVYTDVRKALVNGKSTEKLARQIKKDFDVSAYEASRLINTEVARAMSMAQDEIYSNSDVVERVMWDATLETNTCSICGELDGEYFNKNDHPIVPKHPSCRCCIIPVVDGWKPKKKLENIVDSKTSKKTNIDYTTYNKWYQQRVKNKE